MEGNGEGCGSTWDHLGPRVLEPEPSGPEHVPAGSQDCLPGAFLEQTQPGGRHQPHLRLRNITPRAANLLPREFYQRTQRLPGPRRVGGERREPGGDAHHGGARQIRAAVGPRGEDVRPGARAAAIYDDGEALGGWSGAPRGCDDMDNRGDEEREERGAEAEAAEPAAAAGAWRGGFVGGVRHGGERPELPAAADAAARRDSSTAREVTTTSSFYFILLLYIFLHCF